MFRSFGKSRSGDRRCASCSEQIKNGDCEERSQEGKIVILKGNREITVQYQSGFLYMVHCLVRTWKRVRKAVTEGERLKFLCGRKRTVNCEKKQLNRGKMVN